MDIVEGRHCALCGLPVINGKFMTSKNFGNVELTFCDGKCLSQFYKNYGHLSRSQKFIEQIAPAKTELGGKVRDFLLADVNNMVATVNDAGFGAVTNLVGAAVASFNSPEAKARRAEKAARKREKEEEELQRRLSERKADFYTFDPNGKFRYVKEMTTFAISEFKSFVTEAFSTSYVEYYLSTISQIRKVCVSGIESIKNQKPSVGEKLEKNYNQILGYLSAKYEVDYIQQQNGGSIELVRSQQQDLKNNLANAKKTLWSYKISSTKQIALLSAKSHVSMFKVTKEDVANAKADRDKNIELCNQNIANAKNKIDSEMKGLKEKELQIKKQGKKDLADAKKVLIRFKLGFPSAEQLAHSLDFAKEHNI